MTRPADDLRVLIAALLDAIPREDAAAALGLSVEQFAALVREEASAGKAVVRARLGESKQPTEPVLIDASDGRREWLRAVSESASRGWV